MPGSVERGQSEPGSVGFYDIRPGNGVGLFFQPRSTHMIVTALDVSLFVCRH